MYKRLALLFLFVVFLGGCTSKTSSKSTQPPVRQLVNELAMDKRPFVGIFPHSSGKLLTLLIDRIGSDFKSATIDMEYLSGNSLKGGRIGINLPVSLPYAQGFLLGSCSTGGKCSFDTNLINGTIKTKLGIDLSTIHVLKSDYLFVNGLVNSTDGKLIWKPTKLKQTNQIVSDSQGLPKAFDQELSYAPIMITSTSPEKISGELTIKATASKVKVYDGTSYQDQKANLTDGITVIKLDTLPWSKSVQITRDDQKGASESVTIYAVGPFLLLK